MKRVCIQNVGFLAAALLLGSFAQLRAQDADAPDPEDLRRGVARISLVNGEVSVRRGDSGEWVAAAVNAPLMTQDRVATGPNSRVEIQFDAANVLRAGGNAEVRMGQLEYGKYQMNWRVNGELQRGAAEHRQRRVAAPSVSVRPSKQGMYRIVVSRMGKRR
jgi:hypothetical protein